MPKLCAPTARLRGGLLRLAACLTVAVIGAMPAAGQTSASSFNFWKSRLGSAQSTTYDGKYIALTASGSVAVTRLSDGLRCVFSPNGTERYDYPDGRVHIKYPDGKESLTFPDGLRQVRFNGTTQVFYPDGREQHFLADGRVIVRLPTGAIAQTETRPNGLKIWTYRAGYAVWFFPNGVRKTFFSNGTVVTGIWATGVGGPVPPAGAPAKPLGLEVSVNPGAGLRLQWSDHAWNEQNFIIQRIPAFPGDAVVEVGANVTGWVDPNAIMAAEYRVAAANGGGVSSFTAWTGLASEPGEFPRLIPGEGWTGPTEQPAAVGDPSMPGYDAKAIARWDVVPYQTFEGDFHIGVVAFHMNGIDRVSFSVEGGPWTDVEEMKLNPETGVWEYTVTLRAGYFEDGAVEVRAIAWPEGAGEARVLGGDGTPADGVHSLVLWSNASGSLTTTSTIYVSPSGNDTNPGTETSPVQTLVRGITKVHPGGTIVLMDPGHYHMTDVPVWLWYTEAPAKDSQRWITIRPTAGLTREQVIITQPTRQMFRPTIGFLRWTNVTFDFDTIDYYYPVRSNHVWFDDVTFTDSVGWATTRPNAGLQPIHTSVVSYVTDSIAFDMVYGFVDARLVRSSHVERISGDAYQQSRLVVSCTAHNIDGTITAHHTDLYQTFGSHENTIVYGLTATGMTDVQSIFLQPTPPNWAPGATTNCAFVNMDVEQADPNGLGGPPFSQLQGAFTHVLFTNISVPGQRILIREDVVAQDVRFTSSHVHPITYTDYVTNTPPAGVVFVGCQPGGPG